MRPAETIPQGVELDTFIRAYEAAWACGEPVNVKEFLPEPGHPLYGSVLREVVRADLEYHWAHGQPRPLEEYRSSFPELFCDRESLRAITFEEYRLRCQAGEPVTPAEYENRFGVDVTTWPSLHPDEVADDPTAAPQTRLTSPEDTDSRPGNSLLAAALAYQQWCRGESGPGGAADRPSWEGFDGSWEHAEVFDELHRWEPAVAERLAQAVLAMPRVGGDFHGFRLLAELGSGAFGRVYLTRQGELADRLVVLKIAPYLFGEARALAKLQHNHIVPIYSVHQAGNFQAVCMPFFGTTTLADILTDLRTLPALPDSGKYLLERIEARTREGMDRWGCPSASPDGAAPSERRVPLENLTYAEGILWLADGLADGLAHAHERGIVHRDLKPANILLTDDGQPMLLDFNLCEDTKLHRSASAVRIGGTLPYMAPEQLTAFQKGGHAGDERSDLYSIGIILHELLTGRHPFMRRRGPREEMLTELFAERRRPPEVRPWNPAVSPGAESIVRHCLEPEPSRRYQTAQELHEDLRRQLGHLPLKYAPEPSLRERARKWMRRHPRLSSSAGVGFICTLVVMAVAGAFLLRLGRLTRLRVEQEAQQTRLKAVAARHRLHDDLKTIEILLGSDIPDAEHEQREEGMALAREVLDRYRILTSSDWQGMPLVRALPPDQREQVRDDMGELLLLMAGEAERQAQLDLALRLNDLAVGCYSADNAPKALWRQRVELARSAGHAQEAERSLARAEAAPFHSPRDRYLLLLTEYRQQGRLPEALPWLQEASRRQKDNFSVWMTLGYCYAELGKRDEAVACYDMAVALWPEAPWPYVCRGLAYLEQGNDRRALAAFDEVIRLRPELWPAYFNRALAKYHLGDLSGARADLTHVLSGSEPPLRAYFLRARVRAKQGDREGARQDQEAGLRGEPRDERDLTARGLARQPRDPPAALADYESALKLNPRYLAALQNKANVLAEDLGRTEEAIAALDAVLALYPDYVPARAGRGVLHARLGRREAAHADAEETLRRDSKPFTVYQLAGIYALTSRQNPDDRREAFRLLGSALSQGFGLDLLDRDRDLDAIRDQPEFRRLAEAARTRRTEAPPGTAKPPPPGAAARHRVRSGRALSHRYSGGWEAANRLLSFEGVSTPFKLRRAVIG